MKFCRPVTSMISSRLVSFSASARARHSLAVASGSRYIRTLARPRAMVFSPTTGSTVGSGPSGSWSDRSRFHSCSRNLIAVCGGDLRQAHVVGDVGGLGVGVAEDERRGGQDQQVVVAAAVLWPAGP